MTSPPDSANEIATFDPLRIESLTLRGYRNLAPLTLEPGPRFNVVFGENGSGKSNLLEAIGYVASLRSFRAAKKEDLIGLDEPRAFISARVSGRPLPREYRIVLDRHKGRTVTVNEKRATSLGSYFASIQLVLFHPGDVELMVGAPEHRRAFLDRVLEQVDASYARLVNEYERALRSRNRLLKADRPDRRSITSYDEILANLGARVGGARQRLASELAPRVEEHFAEITEHALPLEVQYAARHEPSEAVLRAALEASYEKDVLRGFTGVGPHGDDLRVAVKRTLAKHFASQGQHRAIVLALKVAELHVLAARTGRMPLLLLDDVSSELDRKRNRRFFQLLERLGGQVFLTTTHREFILLDAHRTDFQVEAGQVRSA